MYLKRTCGGVRFFETVHITLAHGVHLAFGLPNLLRTRDKKLVPLTVSDSRGGSLAHVTSPKRLPRIARTALFPNATAIRQVSIPTSRHSPRSDSLLRKNILGLGSAKILRSLCSFRCCARCFWTLLLCGKARAVRYTANWGANWGTRYLFTRTR